MKSNARNENFVCLNCGAVNGDPNIWLKKITTVDGEQVTGTPLSSLFYGPHEEQYARPRAERPFFDYAEMLFSHSGTLILEKYFDPATPKEADILALDIPTIRTVRTPLLPDSTFDEHDFEILVFALLNSGVEAKAVVASHLWESAPASWRNAFVKGRIKPRRAKRKS